MADLAVQGRDVTVIYGGRVALRGCDLAVPKGAVTALVGPNGSGKSTLLSAIAGLVPVSSGDLRVLGGRPGQNGLATRVAYVLQSTPANESLPMTVREVVTMARFARRGLFGRLRADDRRAVDDALERLEVSDLADRHLRELSGGQRQRVLVAQGLAQEAELLLLDEPVTGLDLTSRERILQVVADVRSKGGSVIVATHDLDDAARADHVLLLNGTVIASGGADQVITPEHLRLAYSGRRLQRQASGRVSLFDEHVHQRDHERR